jgi:hypothetical protein
MIQRLLGYRFATCLLLLLSMLPAGLSVVVQRHRHAHGDGFHSHSHPHSHSHQQRNSQRQRRPRRQKNETVSSSHVHLNVLGFELTLPDWFPGHAPQISSRPASPGNSLRAIPLTLGQLLRTWHAIILLHRSQIPFTDTFCGQSVSDVLLPECCADKPPVPPPRPFALC